MSLQLFDRIRAFIKSAGVYNHENLLQNQSDLGRAIQNDDIINYSSAGLLEQTNIQINRMERYKDYDQMDEMGEVSLALDLYADEATQVDPETKHSISIRAQNKEVKEALENLFFNKLNIDHKLRAMARYLVKYGDLPAEIIPNSERTEIATFKPFNVYNFIRAETQYGDLIGFFFTDPVTSSPQFLHPWQVIHFRLTSYENIFAPYGRAIGEGGRKDYRRLRLMEDAALVYRITRAPQKRVFTIPVGNIPTSQVGAYINNIADQFKKHRFFDPATGEVNWRYAPFIQEDDFWLPQRPDGTGPKVDTMQGAENLDQIKDIEYFKKKMIAPYKIPFSRVGIGDDSGGNADKSLASSHTDFAKAVQFVQQELCVGLKKIALVELALKGFPAEDLKNFDITMTASSAIDELYRIETWNSRAGVIATLKETKMFPDKWILKRFTDLTEDEIEQLEEDVKSQSKSGKGDKEGEGDLAALGGGEGGFGGGLPGLESVDRQQSKVLMEYQKYKTMRNKRIEESKNQYVNMFSYFLNSNELDGLPLSNSTPETIICEHSPFDIVVANTGDVQSPQYIINPLDENDEETKLLIEQYKATLNVIHDSRDAEVMLYAKSI